MTSVQFLDTLPLKAKTYWWAFWWIDSSFSWLNDSIDRARKENRKGDAESLCKVIALKHLYLSKEDETEITCLQCDGTGEVDEEIKESFASQRISPRYKKVKCEACEDGKIKEN